MERCIISNLQVLVNVYLLPDVFGGAVRNINLCIYAEAPFSSA